MQALVPSFIIGQLAEGRLHGHFRAYTLFADLSGFTAMTELLMQRGTEGAEELSRVLNSIFGPTVHEVYQHGGMIPYFAGDSFIGIFPEGSPYASAEGLLEVASLLLGHFDKDGDTLHLAYHIGIKIGMGAGVVEWGIVGDVGKAFYFRGEAIRQCAEAQLVALDGQVVAHEDIGRTLSEDKIVTRDGSYWIVKENRSVVSTVDPATVTAPVEPDNLTELVTQFLPQSVLEFDSGGEFRTVVSVFIAFEGVENHESLNVLATTVLNQLQSFGGYFKEIDFGDKGGVMVCFFGAPVAYENNETRSLEFVQGLREEIQSQRGRNRIKLKIGISSGVAYTGIIGGGERAQYGAAGSRVNLAARLMIRAKQGEVLADDAISRNRLFVFRHEGEQYFKGIAHAVSTFRLMGRNQEEAAIFTGEMIGRHAELLQLTHFTVQHLQERKGGMAFVWGESGVGKSRMTYELEMRLQDVFPEHFWFTCHTERILQKPFNPFVYFFKHYFEQTLELSAADNERKFDENFRLLTSILKASGKQNESILNELERTESVLKALVGLHQAGSLWEQLDAKGRYDNTIIAVTNLLLAAARIKPVVIELEDALWLDESSRELLNNIQARIQESPVLIVVTSRLLDNGQQPEILPQYTLPVLHIMLHQLSNEEVAAFSESRIGGKTHPETLELLQRMTNGNPFYLEQMLAFFDENKLLVQGDDGLWKAQQGSNIKVSNSMSSILTARIDRLSKLVRETVKTAAVIGREFELPILSEVLQHQEEFISANGNMPNVVRDQIQTGERSQIWRAMSELRYIFQQSLLRDSIYDMQLRARLRELHQQVAQAIEKLYAEHLHERYLDLAYHYEQAGIASETRHYLIKAGDHARRDFQNILALDCYQKVENHHFAEMSGDERVAVLLNKGLVEETLGRWHDAHESYTKAVGIAERMDDKLPLARANNSLGYLLMLRGDYDPAQAAFKVAEQHFAARTDYFGLYKTLSNLGNLYFRQGEYHIAKQYFQRSLNLGSGFKTTTTSAQIAITLGLTFMNLGDIKEGIQVMREQLDIAEKQRNRSAMAALLTNLGILQVEHGEDDLAFESFTHGMALSEEIGNKQLISIALGCIGGVWERRNDFKKALDLYQRDLALCLELGDQQGTAICYGLLGNLFAKQGKYKKAIKHLRENMALCKRLKYAKGVIKARKDMASTLARQGKTDKALRQYDKAINKARSTENRLLLAQCLLDVCRIRLDHGLYTPESAEHIEAFELSARLGNASLQFNAGIILARVHAHNGERDIALSLLDDLRRQRLTPTQRTELEAVSKHI